MHLASLLELAGTCQPDADAVIDPDIRLSYREWNRRVNGLAWVLRERGVRPGDRIGICLANREPAPTAYFAAHKAGAVAVPLNTRWKRHELGYALEDCAARTVLFDQSTAEEVHTAASRCPGGIRAVAADGADGFLAALTPRDHAPEGPRLPQETGTILYTSGTTGRPKGVMRTHEQDFQAAVALMAEHRWQRGERALGVMPLYHTMGLHTLITMVALAGTYVMLPRLDPAGCLRAIREEHISALFLVPTAYYDLTEYLRKNGESPPHIPRLAFAGAPMAPTLVAACRSLFRPTVFVNHYGSTEMHLISVHSDLDQDPTAAGSGAILSAIRIVTADRHRPVPPEEVLPAGEVGEVIALASSPRAFSGYLNRPDAMSRSVREGWYFTGDLGYLDDRSLLHLMGRVDDMIISGGENVYPDEVEEVLKRHPQVADAAVVGMPDERWGESIAAFVVPANPSLDAAALEAYCVASPDLARYKRPRQFHFVRALPRSPSGKLLRKQLKERAGGGPSKGGYTLHE